MQEAKLPVPCDFSMTALQLALQIGEENGFGKALKLVHGPENTFPVRQLLALPKKPITNNPDDYLELEMTREFPLWDWHVEFENGKVKSEYPVGK